MAIRRFLTLPVTRFCAASSLLTGLTILSACATATIDNAVPQAAMEPDAQTSAAPLPAPQQAGTVAAVQTPVVAANHGAAMPNNTGQFPNINVVPVGETAQFTPTDEATARAMLANAKAGQQAQGESTAAYQERLRRLRLLARNHAKDTISQIEGK